MLDKIREAGLPAVVGGGVVALAINMWLASALADLTTSVVIFGCGVAVGMLKRK